jgi:hypothetical protein
MQVYNYFRGTGKAAELKRVAAQGAFRAAIWRTWAAGNRSRSKWSCRQKRGIFWANWHQGW